VTQQAATALRAFPMLFRAPMVRALLAGQKTQTRRIGQKPKYAVGDLLWVKEAYRAHAEFDHLPPRDIPQGSNLQYVADRPLSKWDSRYRSSMFMPRWMSRIALKVTTVKVERLQDISEKDAVAEGACFWAAETGSRYLASDQVPKHDFAKLWDSINSKDPAKCWVANPWVAAYSFDVLHTCNVMEIADALS